MVGGRLPSAQSCTSARRNNRPPPAINDPPKNAISHGLSPVEASRLRLATVTTGGAFVGGVDVVGGVFFAGGPVFVVTVGGGVVCAGGADGGGLSEVTGGGVLVGGGLEGVSGGGVACVGGGVFWLGGVSLFLPPWSFPPPLSFPLPLSLPPCSSEGGFSVVPVLLSFPLPFPPPARAAAAVSPRTKAAIVRITPIV